MIDRLGVVYQDTYSLGFLEGLKKRLHCNAERISPPGSVGKSRNMTRRQARQAWMYFHQAKRVNAVVRFTDADRTRWQDVRRDELAVFPNSARSVLVCGVAVNNTEEWLALCPEYLSAQLDLDGTAIQNDPNRSSLIKGAIDRKRGPEDKVSDVVARLVSSAPDHVFKRWLQEPSFRDFYVECRRIAARFECVTPNEL
jgi:hypothetical protein